MMNWLNEESGSRLRKLMDQSWIWIDVRPLDSYGSGRIWGELVEWR